MLNFNIFFSSQSTMADLDDQLLEGGIDLSSEEHNTQIGIENSMSFDLIENGQSNNADSQASADSVSFVFVLNYAACHVYFNHHILTYNYTFRI